MDDLDMLLRVEEENQRGQLEDDYEALRQVEAEADFGPSDDERESCEKIVKSSRAIDKHRSTGSIGSSHSNPSNNFAMRQFLSADIEEHSTLASAPQNEGTTPTNTLVSENIGIRNETLRQRFQRDNTRHFHNIPQPNIGPVSTITLTNGARYHLVEAPSAVAKDEARYGDHQNSTSRMSPTTSGRTGGEKTLRQRLDTENEKHVGGRRSDVASPHRPANGVNRFEELWVNKYRPKVFTELLSDERSNREVLKWVHSWNTRDGLRKKAAQGVQKASISSSNNAKGLFEKPKKRDASGNNKFLSKSPPQQNSGVAGKGKTTRWKNKFADSPPKILLLCGPPGMGKTTLAHVVAEQAGYHPFEINASDNRSASTLITAIESAIEMQAVFGDRRPNLVILDEIDGALGGGDGRNAITGFVGMRQKLGGSLHSGTYLLTCVLY